MNALENALEATRRGLHIFPLAAGKKTPYNGFKWRTGSFNDPALVAQHFQDSTLNYGVDCGKSGLVVVDEDTAGDFHRWQQDTGLAMPETFTVATPSGGTHYYFTQPAGDGLEPLSNHSPFKRDGYDIDVRGTGGYVVGPGSVNGDGVAYKVTRDAPIAPMPDVLEAYLRKPKQAPQPEVIPQVSPAPAYSQLSGERPGDMFDAEHDTPEKLVEYLARFGWQICHKDGEGYQLTRPGKDVSSGPSATVQMHHGRPGLFVFTTSTEFTPETPYTAFGCFTVLEHGGDYKAAARALAGRYGPVWDLPRLDSSRGGDTGRWDAEDTWEAEEIESVSSWEPIDIGTILDSIERGEDLNPRPTVGQIDGAGFLLYPAAINGIYGDAGTGKTFTANAIEAQELTAGRDVLHVDWETGPAPIVTRLLAMGVEADQIRAHFHYVQPDGPFVTGGPKLIRFAQTLKPSLAVIDSTGEALAGEGVNPNADEEVAIWFQRLPRPLALTGAAVLVLDHAAKSEDSSKKGPAGSFRKLAAVTGVQYEQKVGAPFSKVQDGHANLIVRKDRHGTYTAKSKVAQLNISDGGHTVTLTAPEGTFRPTDTMDRVLRALKAEGGSIDGFKALTAAVSGKHDIIRAALEILTQEGHIRQTIGARRKVTYTLARPSEQYGIGFGLLPESNEKTVPSVTVSPLKRGGQRDTVREAGDTVGTQWDTVEDNPVIPTVQQGTQSGHSGTQSPKNGPKNSDRVPQKGTQSDRPKDLEKVPPSSLQPSSKCDQCGDSQGPGLDTKPCRETDCQGTYTRRWIK